MKEILEWFKGNELASNVWLDKYALRKDGVVIEKTPGDTIERIANEFYRIELKYKNPLSYERILWLLDGFKHVIPAGSPLFGIGNNYALTSLSNCYAIDSPVDSYGGIMKTDEELVQLMKRRGGVGVDISTLRPSGAKVSNSAGSSTGAVSFMNRYSNTTKEVAQEGRRGALIITMNVNHPDIIKFIESKDDVSKINGANISIKITDEFMKAVIDDTIFETSFKSNKIGLKAKDIWNKIVHQAWKSAEPGVLFWDKIISESPSDCYEDFKTITTNPCGELPLCSYDSCRLLHVNIASFVVNPFTKAAYFDIDSYRQTVYDSQRLMDDMIDLEEEKLQKILEKIWSDPESTELKDREIRLWTNIKRKLTKGRRTGLDTMLGLADALAMLGYKYDSDEALAVADMIAAVGASECYKSDVQLAKERGAFPDWNYELEKNNPFLTRIFDILWNDGFTDTLEDYKTYGRRNISCLTIPPSGSVAIIAQVSSGIEPVFNLSYTRKRKVTSEYEGKKYQDKNGEWWEEYKMYHLGFQTWKSQTNFDKEEESPYFGSTANQIDPLQKVRLQGLIQQWIDHSISITHNLPETIKEEEVSKIYMEAWKCGCKGVTIYREGSRDGIFTNTKKVIFEQHDAPKRPKSLEHDVYSVMSKGQHWIVSVGIMNNKPYEVFVFNNAEPFTGKIQGEIIKIGKGRYDLKIPNKIYTNITGATSDEENLLTRMISTSLRHGADIRFVVDQLNKSEGDITSFGKAIARVLKKYIPNGTNGSHCTECGHVLVFEGGCEVCPNCGYSKCG
jgi:ribonucleoside-diphosphate reductase alpha chain